MKKCPTCDHEVEDNATVCHFCHNKIAPTEPIAQGRIKIDYMTNVINLMVSESEFHADRHLQLSEALQLETIRTIRSINGKLNLIVFIMVASAILTIIGALLGLRL